MTKNGQGFFTQVRLSAGRILNAALLLLAFSSGLLTGCGRKDRVNLFEGSAAQEALTELSKNFATPAKVLNVDLTPHSLTVQVQDPGKPDHVDEYALEHTYGFDDRIHSVHISLHNPVTPTLVNTKLEENLFSLSDVNIAGVAATAKAAVQRSGIEGGRIAKIHVQRHLFLIPVASSGEVEWHIEVTNDREYATAYADAKGRISHMNLDGTNRARNLNLYADTKELLGIVSFMREAFGGTRGILKLHLNRNYINFDAHDPQKPKRLMSFNANLNGVMMGLDAFKGGPGAEPMPADWFFGVDDVDWSHVPDMLKQAQAKLEIPKGKVYAVSLAKPALEGVAQPIRWTVEIQDGEGENGEVEFDAQGKVTHVKLPKSRRVAVNGFDPEGAAQLIAGLKPSFGPHAKLIELAITGNRAMIVARDPKQPASVRDWMYEDDHFLDVKGMNETPFYPDLQDDSFFDLDEGAAALTKKLAGLEKATLERLKMPGGKIEKVTLFRRGKMQPPNPKVTIQINAVSPEGKNGWVSYDLEGNFMKMMQASP